MRDRRDRAVVLLEPCPYPERARRHERAALGWIGDHRHDLVSLTYDRAAALALVAGDLADVVVILADVDTTYGLSDELLAAGGRLETVWATGRRPTERRTDRISKDMTALITSMLTRGGEPDTIARLLDLPLVQVEAVANVSRPSSGRPDIEPAGEALTDVIHLEERQQAAGRAPIDINRRTAQ